jgi:hypothetical protein
LKWVASLDLGGGKAGIDALETRKVCLKIDPLFERTALGIISTATTGLGNFQLITDHAFTLTVTASL